MCALRQGVLDGLRRMVDEEGLAALWNGMGPSLILVRRRQPH